MVFELKTEASLADALAAYCDKHELPHVCANELLMAYHAHVVWLAAFCDQWEKVQGANDKLLDAVKAQGLDFEIGGGGCQLLTHYIDGGGFVWATCLDGGGLPETNSWMVCAYGEDLCDILFELRSDQNDDGLSLTQAVAIALDVAHEHIQTLDECTLNGHRDSGRGVCVNCGDGLL